MGWELDEIPFYSGPTRMLGEGINPLLGYAGSCPSLAHRVAMVGITTFRKGTGKP